MPDTVSSMATSIEYLHPEHTLEETVPGVFEPVIPPEITGWAGFKLRRACHKTGGHWWHPVNPMTGWFCCNCGARTDGMPKDGSRW